VVGLCGVTAPTGVGAEAAHVPPFGAAVMRSMLLVAQSGFVLLHARGTLFQSSSF
jgi:hypothetical protein